MWTSRWVRDRTLARPCWRDISLVLALGMVAGGSVLYSHDPTHATPASERARAKELLLALQEPGRLPALAPPGLRAGARAICLAGCPRRSRLRAFRLAFVALKARLPGAAAALAELISQGSLEELLFAPHFATWALLGLTDQSDPSPEHHTYTAAQRTEIVARARQSLARPDSPSANRS